jgi:hypothetical protein
MRGLFGLASGKLGEIGLHLHRWIPRRGRRALHALSCEYVLRQWEPERVPCARACDFWKQRVGGLQLQRGLLRSGRRGVHQVRC